MVKKNGRGNAPARIDVRLALKPTKTDWSSREKTHSTGKIMVFAVAVILFAIILFAVAIFIYSRSK
jgi:hypothetical protein